MINFTLCASKDCPIAGYCYRYIAIPFTKHPSYGDFYKEHAKYRSPRNCVHFLRIQEEDKINPRKAKQFPRVFFVAALIGNTINSFGQKLSKDYFVRVDDVAEWIAKELGKSEIKVMHYKEKFGQVRMYLEKPMDKTKMNEFIKVYLLAMKKFPKYRSAIVSGMDYLEAFLYYLKGWGIKMDPATNDMIICDASGR